MRRKCSPASTANVSMRASLASPRAHRRRSTSTSSGVRAGRRLRRRWRGPGCRLGSSPENGSATAWRSWRARAPGSACPRLPPGTRPSATAASASTADRTGGRSSCGPCRRRVHCGSSRVQLVIDEVRGSGGAGGRHGRAGMPPAASRVRPPRVERACTVKTVQCRRSRRQRLDAELRPVAGHVSRRANCRPRPRIAPTDDVGVLRSAVGPVERERDRHLRGATIGDANGLDAHRAVATAGISRTMNVVLTSIVLDVWFVRE